MSENKTNPPNSDIQQKAIEWIKKKSANKGCEVCGQNHWGISTDIVTPVLFNNNSFHFGGNAYPCVAMVCNNCGNTKLINAVVAGIIETNKKDGSQDGK